MSNTASVHINQQHPLLSFGSPHPVTEAGIIWRTAEHLYQASKFVEPGIRSEIAGATTAEMARMQAYSCALFRRYDWYERRTLRRRRIHQMRIDQHADIREALLETEGQRIVVLGDHSYWSQLPNGEGKNVDGEILMRIRDHLLRTARNAA